MPIAQCPRCRDCKAIYLGVPWWARLSRDSKRPRCAVTGRWVHEDAPCSAPNDELVRLEATLAAVRLSRGEALGVTHHVKVAEDGGTARYREIELDREPVGEGRVFWKLKGKRGDG